MKNAVPALLFGQDNGALRPDGSVRSRAKIRQNHNDWYFMDVAKSLHLAGWRET
jgi:hypothetical protein